jgi:ubiquinone/menaquinone biosynthesis C-methylase UbiE
MNSEEISNKFYQTLGTAGMSALTTPDKNTAYIKFLSRLLPKDGRILDCACGYGRLTIPLAQKGFAIEGVDIADNLIADAINFAAKANLAINFTIGNMCALPYQDNSFAYVICMWSSFLHLLTVQDQLTALCEMLRVTQPTGTILLDLPCPKEALKELQQHATAIDTQQRVFKNMIAGVENTTYFHDKQSIKALLDQIDTCTYELKMQAIGMRRIRFIVEIVKK